MTFPRMIALAFVCLVVVSGCSEKAKPVPIEGLKLVKDELRMFEIKVPTNWYVQQRTGDLVIATTTRTIGSRFMSFGKGNGGAKIELRVIPIDSNNPSLDTMIKRSKVEFEDNLDRYQVSQATLGGKSAKKLAVKFDQADGEFQIETYFAENDSLVTIVTIAAFGKTYEDYRKEFDEVLASVKVAHRPVVVAKVASTTSGVPEPPSDTLRTYNAPDFSIEIPQNFEGKKGQSSGLSSVSFLGSRFDCTIQVDVFDASKQNDLNKIVDQNKGRYQGGNPISSSVNGQNAFYFNYNPAANVSSRAYFTVRGNKMFRITLNWYKPEQALYLAIFERCIGTMRLK